jgi:nicotinamide-nucleotide amidase
MATDPAADSSADRGMFPPDVEEAARATLSAARRAGVTLATAESCTGGLVAGVLTAIAGSSDVVDRGFVTYSNAAKIGMLGVPAHLIDAHGAVSEPVARAMAAGARASADVGVSVAITGIAGPGGGSAEKPVGLVWFAAASAAGVTAREARFGDIGREAVRLESVRVALTMLQEAISASGA